MRADLRVQPRDHGGDAEGKGKGNEPTRQFLRLVSLEGETRKREFTIVLYPNRQYHR